jgi:putative sterol carrier protein
MQNGVRLPRPQRTCSGAPREIFVTIEELAEKAESSHAWVPGKRVRLDLRDQGSILLDGVAERVCVGEEEADTVISATWGDWKALSAGQLDPIGAFMNGRLRVEGDLSVAMQLQGVLSKAFA